MITEFNCGVWQVCYNEIWRLTCNNHCIASIEEDGNSIMFHTLVRMSEHDLIEIAVLMNNIKRQYKQLQVTNLSKDGSK